MRVSKIAAAIALAGLAVPTIAQASDVAQQVGHVAAASGDVLIARDGKLVPAVSGQALYQGDRVVTRAGGNAKVALNGCTQAVAPTSIMAVSNNCSAPKSLAPSAAGFQGGNAIHGSSWLVALLALTAIIGGVIAATSNNKNPVSP